MIFDLVKRRVAAVLVDMWGAGEVGGDRRDPADALDGPTEVAHSSVEDMRRGRGRSERHYQPQGIHYQESSRLALSVSAEGRGQQEGYIGPCRRLEGGQGVPLVPLDGPCELAPARAAPYDQDAP